MTEYNEGENYNEPKITKGYIYVDIDDEVSDILLKIENSNEYSIHLIVPKGAQLFDSIINLKILKRKISDLNKILQVISVDLKGLNLAAKLDIPTSNKLNIEGDDIELEHDLNSEDEEDYNFMEDDPDISKSKKFSINDFLNETDTKVFSSLLSKIENIAAKLSEKKNKNQYIVVVPNKENFIVLLLSSLFVFFIIIYIALPSATIQLVPNVEKIDKNLNIIFADYKKNKAELSKQKSNIVSSFYMQFPVDYTFTHQSSGEVAETDNATGIIKIINKSNKDWYLVPNTRFQTKEGIIFRTQHSSNIPRQKGATPGTFDVEVKADSKDIYGMPVGSRGNVVASKFNIPGLQESSQKTLYGESQTAMTGGSSLIKQIITKADIDAARNKANDELEKHVLDELQKRIAAESQLNETEFVLIHKGNSILFDDIIIKTPDQLIGKELKSFQVRIVTRIKAMAYNKYELLNILNSQLHEKRSPGKILVKIYNDDINFDVLEFNPYRAQMRATVMVSGLEEFNLDTKSKKGKQIINNIKQHIVGQNIEEAQIFIQNLNEINDSHIEVWPPWSPRLPKLIENIEIKDVKELK